MSTLRTIAVQSEDRLGLVRSLRGQLDPQLRLGRDRGLQRDPLLHLLQQRLQSLGVLDDGVLSA